MTASWSVASAYLERFGMRLSNLHLRMLNKSMCWQLCLCRSDEARRLLLGCSERMP